MTSLISCQRKDQKSWSCFMRSYFFNSSGTLIDIYLKVTSFLEAFSALSAPGRWFRVVRSRSCSVCPHPPCARAFSLPLPLYPLRSACPRSQRRRSVEAVRGNLLESSLRFLPVIVSFGRRIIFPAILPGLKSSLF